MNEHARNILRSKWSLIVAAWTLYGLYMAVQSIVVRAELGSPISWQRAIFNEMIYAYLWLGLTPLVIMLATRYRFQKRRWLAAAAVHAIAGFLIAFLHKGVHGILAGWYQEVFENTPFSWQAEFQSLLRNFDYGIHLYALVIILFYAFEFYNRFREKEIVALQLESQLAQAKLDALRMQLHPHFLFNTLNAI